MLDQLKRLYSPLQHVNANNRGVTIEISIKCNDSKCTVYDDRKRTELGTCDYSKVCSVLRDHLESNKIYHFGLSQKTLKDLNIDSYKKNIEEEYTRARSTATLGKQKYFNARRTPQEDAELRREMMKDNNEIRRQEREVIEISNGTKKQVNTNSIK